MSNLADHLKKVGETMIQNLGGGGVREALPSPARPAAEAAPGNRPGDPDDQRTRARGFWLLPVEDIEPDSGQPRQEFDEESLEQMGRDIARRGLLQPIRVRKNPSGKYTIIAGERRWRASRMAGVKQLPCQVIDGEMTEAEILEEQLVENLQRQDLLEVEKARAYRQLLDANNWTQASLAQALSLSMASVSRTLKLLELDGQVQQYVAEGKLPASTAYEITRIADPDRQRQLADRAVAEGLTREAVGASVEAEAGRRQHKATRTGTRLACRLPDGGGVTLSNGEPLTADRIIEILQRVLIQARKLKAKNLPVEDLPALLKSAGKEKPPAKEPAESEG